MEMAKMNKLFIVLIVLVLGVLPVVQAEQETASQELTVVETAQPGEQVIDLSGVPAAQAVSNADAQGFDPTRYTLGPDDVIQIDVMRHPEFSGTYAVSLEGKIQYKFVGDIEVTGLKKQEVEERIRQVISKFVVNPDVNVTILEFKSKVIYVLGEVSRPGKYYMRSETMPVREAVVQAGLPTLSAAMRKCKIVTPDANGRIKERTVDLYSLLYGGNLRLNYDMRAGDVLYVPSTVMAKIIRIINPVTATVNGVANGPSSISTGKSAITNLAK